MKTFTETMEQVAEALSKSYGELLDSMFDFFYAGDIDEMTPVNIGIVIKGARSQAMEDYTAEVFAWARKVCKEPFRVIVFSKGEYSTWAEELDFGRFYWMHGAKSDVDLTLPAVIWFDENTPESEWIM